MNPLTGRYRFRDSLVAALARDLMGEGCAPEEVIDEPPLDRYIVGVLHPRAEGFLQLERDDPDPADCDGAGEDRPDPGVSMARMRYPSSVGLTFAVDLTRAGLVHVRACAARYERITVEGDRQDRGSSGHTAHRDGSTWRRVPGTVHQSDLDHTTTASPMQEDECPGLVVPGVVRAPRNGKVAVTLTLCNTQPEPEGLRDGACWFQPLLEVRTDVPAFVDRQEARSVQLDDDELESYDLLYRQARKWRWPDARSTGIPARRRSTDWPSVSCRRTRWDWPIPAGPPARRTSGCDICTNATTTRSAGR